MGLSSFFLNPYRSSRKFFGLTYGETPLSAFAELIQAAGVTKEDLYVELGSGRGKTCFWAALFVGCKVRGVECVPALVRLSRFLSWLLGVKVTFEKGWIEEVNISDATVIYLYHLSDFKLEIPKGCKIITTSEPLPGYTVIQTIPIVFPWGKTNAYILK